MIGYAVRRLALLVPTLFISALVLFSVLSFAPGRPGADEGGQAAAERESWRAFRAQFHLDLPVILNTRPWWSAAEGRRWLALSAGLVPGASARERRDAEDALEDGGDALVLPLLAVVEHDPDASVVRQAAERLSRLVPPSLLPPPGPSLSAAWGGQRAALEARYAQGTLASLRTAIFETRFAHYLGSLARLDFGRSVVDRAPVIEIIAVKLVPTLCLSGLSLCLAYLIAVPIGVFGAARAGSRRDRALTWIVLMLYSAPSFFLATILLRVFSEGAPFRWLPPAGFGSVDAVDRTTLEHLKDVAWHLVLPVSIYTAVSLAALSRYARAGVLEIVRSDFVRAARARGLSEVEVMVYHAARNGMLPILTLLGGMLPVLFSGSVVIEVVFGIPGMGMYLFESISARDYNAVMGVLVIASLLTMLGVLLSDLAYAALDPRVSFD
ncbi:MAG: ABC transporter permease [Myxococcota bacterium]